jgi:hypothetical protein
MLHMQVDVAKGMVKVLYNSRDEYEHITGRLDMLREWRVCYAHTLAAALKSFCTLLSHRLHAICPTHAEAAGDGVLAPLATEPLTASF